MKSEIDLPGSDRDSSAGSAQFAASGQAWSGRLGRVLLLSFLFMAIMMTLLFIGGPAFFNRPSAIYSAWMSAIPLTGALGLLTLGAGTIGVRFWRLATLLSWPVILCAVAISLAIFWNVGQTWFGITPHRARGFTFVSWIWAVGLTFTGMLGRARLPRRLEALRWVSLVTLLLCAWVLSMEALFGSYLAEPLTGGFLLLVCIALLGMMLFLHVLCMRRGPIRVVPVIADVSISCPRCQSALTLKPGRSFCGQCRLVIHIGFEESFCGKCGYSLRDLPSSHCPECGTLAFPESPPAG